MHLKRLSSFDRRVVGEMLWAAVEGPFFGEREFATLFGLTRAEVRGVAEGWPLPVVEPDVVERAVRNAFNQMLGYPVRNKKQMWGEWISVEPATASEVFDRLRGR